MENINNYLSPCEVLLIGDRNIDFTEGSEAGLDNILLVEYGWGYNPEEIPEYDRKFLIKNPKDILEAVEKLVKEKEEKGSSTF